MYQIYRNRERRIKTEYIILAHARNLHDLTQYIKPSVKLSSYSYTWAVWQKYFMRDIQKGTVTEANSPTLPMHYFVELLDEDYVAFAGIPHSQPSWYIQELVDANILPYKYKNSILIVIGEDYTIDVAEDRMFEHLCQKVLSGLAYDYKLGHTHIITMDDALSIGWKEQHKLSNLNYDIALMKNFSKVRLVNIYDKHKRNSR